MSTDGGSGDVYRASPSGSLLVVALGSTGGLSLLRADGSGAATVLLSGGSPVAAVAFSQCEDMVASVSDDKSVRVWSTAGSAEPIVSLTSQRKPSAVAFASAPDGQALLLVGGKTGDVLAYRLPGLEGGPVYLLTHTASMLTAMVVAGTGGVLVTADRDEKIRVSQFPQTSRVVAYCLGHTAFVSSLLVPQNAPGLLLSGGGDGTVRLWAFAEGQQLASVEVGSEAEAAAADADADDDQAMADAAAVVDLAYCELPPSSSQWGCAAAVVCGRAEVPLFLVRRGAGVETDDEEVGSTLVAAQRIPLPARPLLCCRTLDDHTNQARAHVSRTNTSRTLRQPMTVTQNEGRCRPHTRKPHTPTILIHTGLVYV